MYKLEKFYKKGFNPNKYWDDKYAREHIAGKSSEEFEKQNFWPLLQQQLNKSDKYLDAGCGIGGWIIFLKERGYDVEGIDIAAKTVRALTDYDPELRVKVSGITRIPYPDQSLDGVLSIGVLEYVEGRVPEALNEASRVLKPGGWLFIEVPMANLIRRLFYLPLKLVEKKAREAQGMKPSFANYLFTREDLKQELEHAGFEVDIMQAHELPDADSHYGLWIDFKFLRGKEPYKLNVLGLLIKNVCNAVSPWIASTGMIVLARKK
jgi:ubiquinone/menaquinone biosynthesis C-methylase UbiE